MSSVWPSNSFRRRSLGALALCAAVGATEAPNIASAQPEIYGHPDSSAFYLIPPDTDDWTRHFSIGPLAAFNIGVKFSIVPGQLFKGISGNNVAAGIFDDGYVRPDQSGNSGSTGYWGYNNASQYNAANNTLTMTATSSYSIPSGENHSMDAGALVGVDVVYGVNFWYWKHARVGFDLGISYLPLHVSDNQPLTAAVNQTSYVFPTFGNVIPSAGYQGNSSGFNEPHIGLTPTSSTPSQMTDVHVTGSRTLDANIFILRLGPAFYWDLTDHVGMNLGAGPALGIVSAQYSYNETLTFGETTAHNVGSFDDLGFQYGGYVNLTFYYHLNESVDLFLGGQFMTMDDYTISSGGREASLDLGSQIYISGGINWPF